MYTMHGVFQVIWNLLQLNDHPFTIMTFTDGPPEEIEGFGRFIFTFLCIFIISKYKNFNLSIVSV